MLTLNDATGDPKVQVRGDIEFVDQPIQDRTNALIIGPTERGPAFVPKTLRNESELKSIFGIGETYVTYAARKALEDTDRIKVQRVMHEKGWKGDPIVLKIDISQIKPVSIANQGSTVTNDEVVAAILNLSEEFKSKVDLANTKLKAPPTQMSPTVSEFVLELNDKSGNKVRSYNLSFDPASRKYIGTVVDEENELNLYLNFKDTQQELFGLQDDLEVTESSSFQNSPQKFSNQKWKEARTPWIVSQTIGGNKRFPLFRFVSRSAGQSENERFKISINQIGDFREDSEYGFFTVLVRAFNDNDFNQEILERFEDVTLDPSHDRFIGNVIGDKFDRAEGGKIKHRGRYENQSDYIRVVLHPDRKKAGVEALPYGFEPYSPPVSRSFLNKGTFFQNIKYRNEQSVGKITEYITLNRPESGGRDFEKGIHLGFDFQREENFSWLNPVSDYFDTCFSYDYFNDLPNQTCKNVGNYIKNNTNQSDFHLEDAAAQSNDYKPDSIEKRKFTVALQGGFDGANPYRKKAKSGEITDKNVWGFNLSKQNTVDYKSYKKALNVVDERVGGFDYNLLSLPGLNLDHHELLLSEVDSIARKRGDFFHVADITGFGSTVDQAINVRNRYDTNYTAGYLGWLNVEDTDQFHDLVPASATIPAVYIRSDNIDAPWFTPSGYNRGVVEDVQDVNIRRDTRTRDELYNEDINSISYFNPDQIIVWGQKTLSTQDSDLHRINVRRLLITIKTRTAEIAEDYLFEQQSRSTKQRFERRLREYLAGVRSNQGIQNFDLSLEFGGQNSNERLSPYTIEGTMRIVPIGVVEYVLVNFTVRESQIIFT